MVAKETKPKAAKKSRIAPLDYWGGQVGKRTGAGAPILDVKDVSGFVLVTIGCTVEGCKNTRAVAPQDAFQVHRCKSCQAKAVKAARKVRAKARRHEKAAAKAASKKAAAKAAA